MVTTTLVASVLCLVVVPATIVGIRMLVGPAEAVAVFAGSAISTAFFASTSVVGIVAWNSDDLRSPLIGTYAIKVSLLTGVWILLTPVGLDGGAFAVAATASAFSYLLLQLIAVVRDKGDRNK